MKPLNHYLLVLVLPILAIVSLNVYASAVPSGTEYLEQQKGPAKEITYICPMYTKNTIFADRTTTDHQPVTQNTKVVKTGTGFTFHQGSAFTNTFHTEFSQAGSAGSMSGNETTLVLLKEDKQLPYFIIYYFDKPKVVKDDKVVEPGAPKELIVLAQCEVKEVRNAISHR